MSYVINSKKTWFQTEDEIENEFKLWHVTEHSVRRDGQGAVLRWIHPAGGQTVKLESHDQSTAPNNLRKLFLIVQALRLNEARGFVQQAASFYAQTTEVAIQGGQVDRLGEAFTVLGLRRDSEWEPAEAAWKALAKKWHPDGPLGMADPELAGKKASEINSAFEEVKRSFGR